MFADLYWIDIAAKGRLATTARPRSGERLADEIAAWKAQGVVAVLSLLEASEINELGLQREEALCREAGIDFFSFPVPDMGVPDSFLRTSRLAARLAARMASGDSIAIHCRAGIGRSSLMAAAVMLHLGISPEHLFDRIAQARRLPVPDTEAQKRWIGDLALKMRLPP